MFAPQFKKVAGSIAIAALFSAGIEGEQDGC
jgi:hypothetical protein